MADNWHRGNANADADQHRGWLLGHFIEPESDIRHTTDLEIKWGIHAAGERRASWTSGEKRTTLVVLISGRLRIDLSVGNFVLERQGDYLIWAAGIDHFWEAEADTVVMTVRWPSITETGDGS
jgi:hypothetical protein